MWVRTNKWWYFLLISYSFASKFVSYLMNITWHVEQMYIINIPSNDALERFTRTILFIDSFVTPLGCWFFVRRFHAFASSRIITPEFHNITCGSLCKVLQAPASMLYGFIQQDRHQFCIFSWRSLGVPWFVLVLLECLCKWEKYDSLRLNFHENHFHLILKKFPQTKLITTNSSFTKVKKFSPITPERRGIYYSIAITIHNPVTAGNFSTFLLLLSLLFSWILLKVFKISIETNFFVYWIILFFPNDNE